jgi:hypothetical protein
MFFCHCEEGFSLTKQSPLRLKDCFAQWARNDELFLSAIRNNEAICNRQIARGT